MKNQNNQLFKPDWLPMSYSGAEFENDLETDGNEEEEEFRFFNSGSYENPVTDWSLSEDGYV